MEKFTGALSAAWAFSSFARLRNTKPKGKGFPGMDPSPVGNDPATPVVCKGTEGTLCTHPVVPGTCGSGYPGYPGLPRGPPTPYAGAGACSVVLGDERIRPRTVR
ncbi:hypothetical protein GCM10010320_09200 [Streptomyces caelestis]|nr:hypothetical protein GCM10010320_09200 [Streptomyces caelestis]